MKFDAFRKVVSRIVDSDLLCKRVMPELLAGAITYSQYRQDLVLSSLCAGALSSNDFIFIDIGAHDGITFSNSYFLENNPHVRGFCIEANPVVFENLHRNRPNATCINVAISDSNRESTFRLNSGHTEMLSGLIDSYSGKHLDRIEKESMNYGDSSELISVPTFTLESLCNKYQLSHVDLLLIDVEGAEYEVLRGINFAECFIRFICVERNYSSTNIRQLLRAEGFVRLFQVGSDDIYFNTRAQLHS